jgi:hypothetical protein
MLVAVPRIYIFAFLAEKYAIFDVLFQLRGMMNTVTVLVEQIHAVHGELFQV